MMTMTTRLRSSAKVIPGQAELRFPKRWGGRREGAGRPPRPAWAQSVPHITRPLHRAAHPVHVTLRARRASGASLRTQCILPLVRRAIRETNGVAGGDAFRIVHFSVQTNHVHLIVEANDKAALRRGATGLAVRAARAINRELGRRGSVWSERVGALSRALHDNAAARPKHHRLRPLQREEAPAGRVGFGPLLLGAVVRWLSQPRARPRWAAA